MNWQKYEAKELRPQLAKKRVCFGVGRLERKICILQFSSFIALYESFFFHTNSVFYKMEENGNKMKKKKIPVLFTSQKSWKHPT